MTPFSVENVSGGSPRMFQSRTSEGSARKSENEKPSDAGILSSAIIGSHVRSTSSARYSLGKGPAYDMNAAATTTSPCAWR
jgi:hypothetical protein